MNGEDSVNTVREAQLRLKEAEIHQLHLTRMRARREAQYQAASQRPEKDIRDLTYDHGRGYHRHAHRMCLMCLSALLEEVE